MKRVVEQVTLVIVILVTVVIVVVSLQFERRLGNQKSMYYQLQALRTSVSLFKAINKRNPNDLTELVVGEFKFPDEDGLRHYVNIPDVDKTGEVIDPFGNPYSYDAQSGWVKSRTPGYEYW